MCVCVYIYIYIYLCVCLCVCVCMPLIQLSLFKYLTDSLFIQNHTTPVSDMLEQVKDNQLLLSFSLLWALNTYMSTSYTTHVDSQASDVGILQSHSLVC